MRLLSLVDSPLAAIQVRAKSIPVAAAVALVALLASLTYLVDIGHPGYPVWDESYYLTTTIRYEEGIAQFASHPPLALMLIAAGDELLQVNRGVDTTIIGVDKKVAGEQIPKQFSFAGVRVASGVFAVAGAVAFFALMLALTGSVIASVFLANLYVFENAYIVHFRAAHLDGFQIFFTLCMLLCFVACIKRGTRSSALLDFTLGLACGLASMVKVNAIVLAALGVMIVAWRARMSWNEQPAWKVATRAVRDGGLMVAGGLLAIFAVFSLHVLVGQRPPDINTPAGQKDIKFVSAPYLEYLQGKRPFSPAVVIAATEGYSRFMHDDFTGITHVDSNASWPMQWPLHEKTINYRWDAVNGITRYVQLCGNQFSWALALLAPLAALSLLILQKLHPCAAKDPHRRTILVMLLLQYVVFMAVHAWLGTQRVMYLYHYFIGLLLAFCLVPLVWMEAADRWRGLQTRLVPVMAGATVLLLASFAFYAPLTYHLPLSHAECERRNALQQIVDCVK